jgi:hypothetical protein
MRWTSFYNTMVQWEEDVTATSASLNVEEREEAWCRTPYQYGRYDVIMHRAKGHEAFPLATKEFHGRNLLNRLLARLCVGRGLLVRGTVAALGGVARTAHCLGARRLASFALSGIFQPSVLAGRM